ncbi:MAG: Phasin, partial [Rhodobacteraceae bacterium]
MTNADEYTKMMNDMMGAMPMDTSALQDAFKSQAA